jgi:hypothetical protein
LLSSSRIWSTSPQKSSPQSSINMPNIWMIFWSSDRLHLRGAFLQSLVSICKGQEIQIPFDGNFWVADLSSSDPLRWIGRFQLQLFSCLCWWEITMSFSFSQKWQLFCQSNMPFGWKTSSFSHQYWTET